MLLGRRILRREEQTPGTEKRVGRNWVSPCFLFMLSVTAAIILWLSDGGFLGLVNQILLSPIIIIHDDTGAPIDFVHGASYLSTGGVRGRMVGIIYEKVITKYRKDE